MSKSITQSIGVNALPHDYQKRKLILKAMKLTQDQITELSAYVLIPDVIDFIKRHEEEFREFLKKEEKLDERIHQTKQ